MENLVLTTAYVHELLIHICSQAYFPKNAAFQQTPTTSAAPERSTAFRLKLSHSCELFGIFAETCGAYAYNNNICIATFSCKNIQNNFLQNSHLRSQRRRTFTLIRYVLACERITPNKCLRANTLT